MDIKKLSDDIYLFSDDEKGYYGNSTIIMTSEVPIIVDVFKDKKQFDNVIKFINKKGYDKPFAIIYTHWHTDHVCGNRQFDDCNIIAHSSTLEHMKSLKYNDLERLKQKNILEQDTRILLPNIVFEKTLSLNIGGRVIRLIHCPGHTYDSILVFDELDKVLIAGDNIIGEEAAFFMPPVIPPDTVDSKPEFLEEAYNKMESLNAAIIVPGHGSIKETSFMLELNRKRYHRCIEQKLEYIE